MQGEQHRILVCSLPEVLLRYGEWRCATSGTPERMSSRRPKRRVSYSAIPPVGSVRDKLTQDRATCLVSISIFFLSLPLLEVSSLPQCHSPRAEVLNNLLSSCGFNSIEQILDD